LISGIQVRTSRLNTPYEPKPPIGVPIEWWNPYVPSWAFSFIDGAYHTWASCPKLNNDDFKALLNSFNSVLITTPTVDGWYAPKLQALFTKLSYDDSTRMLYNSNLSYHGHSVRNISGSQGPIRRSSHHLRIGYSNPTYYMYDYGQTSVAENNPVSVSINLIVRWT
jgi:hypothetical protein